MEQPRPACQELVFEADRKSAEYEIQLAKAYDNWSRNRLEERGMQINRLVDV